MNNEMNDIKNPEALNQAELTNKLNVINARTEALSIIVNIINSFLNSSSTKLSESDLANLQYAVNMEHLKTSQLFAEVEKILIPNMQTSEEHEELINE